MIAIAVDDESWALTRLVDAINCSDDISEVNSFSSCKSTLEWSKQNNFDIAFLDVNMRGIGGIELAKKLKEINPNCYIIFCTGYQEYAFDAFGLHANGYLLKPITADKVQSEIDHITPNKTSNKLLNIKCFGGFEVKDRNNNLVIFSRSKTKELFALLVDRKGMGLTSKEICVILWENGNDNDKRNMQYLWNLFSDLTKTLKTVGAENVLIKSGTNHLIDTSLISCDYYDYLDGTKPALNPYNYMPYYSWAEETIASMQ